MNASCDLLIGEGKRKTCAAGKKRNITGELLKRRDSGKRNIGVVLKLNSLKDGVLAEWDHQEDLLDRWDLAHLWRELEKWDRYEVAPYFKYAN